MKTFIILGIAGLLICSSCQEQKKETQVAAISGTISNHSEKVLKLVDFFGKSEWSQTLEVSENSFEQFLALEKPVIKILQYGEMRKVVFLEPNKSLKVYLDANNPEKSYRYEGVMALENSILDSVVSIQQGVNYRYIYGQELDLAGIYLDSLKSESKDLLQRNSIANQTSTDFNKYTNAYIDYKIAGLKIMLGERKDSQPDNYYAFLDKLTLTEPDLLDIPEYRSFLFYYLNRESNLSLKKSGAIQSPDSEFTERLKAIEQLENDDIRAYSLYNTMVMKLRKSNLDDFEKPYNYFKTHNTDAHYKNQLKIAVDKKKEIAAGTLAPEFALYDINNEERSLNDFKGQYVLLDFWNSRCSRCTKDLPYFMELQSEYENENIAFVSISNDPDPDTWKTYVQNNKDVGTSLWSAKAWDSEIFKAYQVSGTPTYVLIDKEGKIINPLTPRPSSPEIRNYLNEILDIQ